MTDIVSSLNYTAPLELNDREKSFYLNIPALDGVQSNQRVEKYDDIVVQYIRNELNQFDVDKQGFEVVKGEGIALCGDFDSDSWVRSKTYPIVERVLKARFGDVENLIFDHTVHYITVPCDSAGPSGTGRM